MSPRSRGPRSKLKFFGSRFRRNDENGHNGGVGLRSAAGKPVRARTEYPTPCAAAHRAVPPVATECLKQMAHRRRNALPAPKHERAVRCRRYFRSSEDRDSQSLQGATAHGRYEGSCSRVALTHGPRSRCRHPIRDRMQGIRDVLEGDDDCAAVHFRRLVKGCVGVTFLVQQSAGVDDRFRRGSNQSPKGSVGCHGQLVELVGGEPHTGEPIGGNTSDCVIQEGPIGWPFGTSSVSGPRRSGE